MLEEFEAIILAGLVVFGLIGLMILLVVRARSKPSSNTEVWGTVFENFSHYVQPQKSLKEPQEVIVKQKRQAGDDPDKNDAL